jgi:peptidoglycan-associated lipoprotein
MKRRTLVNMLLIAGMLSALGCAQNEAMRRDEGLVPAAPQRTVEPRKEVPVLPGTSDSLTSAGTDAKAVQIVPADASADTQQNSLEQNPALSTVYFGFDSYILTPESGTTLQANFKKLAGRPMIRIEGHCDEQGSSEYNLALGEKRARAAQTYLVTLGYPAGKISAISYGKERPADKGHDEAAWAKNRRAELKIGK